MNAETQAPLNAETKSRFFRTLARGAQSGMPASTALDLLGPDRAFAALSARMRKRAAAGEPLAKIFSDERAFNVFDAAMVEAAETSGHLAEGFDALANRYEARGRLKLSVAVQMIYPLYLFGALGVTVMVLFVGGGLAGPAFTALAWEIAGIALGALALVVTIALPVFYFPHGQNAALQKLFLALPFPYGTYIRLKVFQPFLDAFQYLYVAGVPVSRALEIAAQATDVRALADDAGPVARGLRNGADFQRSLTLSELLPADVRQALILGEQTGGLDRTVRELEVEYSFKLQTLNKQIPIALSLVAAFVLLGAGVFAFSKLAAPVAEAYNWAFSL